MTESRERRVELLAVSDGGVVSKLDADGLRIPFARDAWMAIDFRRPVKSVLEAMIRWDSTRVSYVDFPKLVIVPHAGNYINIEVTISEDRQGGSLEVFPVNGQNVRRRLLESSFTAASGDPVGEIVLRDRTVSPIMDRAFRIQCAGLGDLQLKVAPSETTGIRVEIKAEIGGIPRSGESLVVPSMFVRFHAANLVSVILSEYRGLVIA